MVQKPKLQGLETYPWTITVPQLDKDFVAPLIEAVRAFRSESNALTVGGEIGKGSFLCEDGEQFLINTTGDVDGEYIAWGQGPDDFKKRSIFEAYTSVTNIEGRRSILWDLEKLEDESFGYFDAKEYERFKNDQARQNYGMSPKRFIVTQFQEKGVEYVITVNIQKGILDIKPRQYPNDIEGNEAHGFSDTSAQGAINFYSVLTETLPLVIQRIFAMHGRPIQQGSYQVLKFMSFQDAIQKVEGLEKSGAASVGYDFDSGEIQGYDNEGNPVENRSRTN